MTVSIFIATDTTGDLRSLRNWLLRVDGAKIELPSGLPAPGRQGSGLELLTVIAGSGGVGAAVLATVQTWLQSRRCKVRLKVRKGDVEREVEVDSSNIQDVMPILKKILDD